MKKILLCFAIMAGLLMPNTTNMNAYNWNADVLNWIKSIWNDYELGNPIIEPVLPTIDNNLTTKENTDLFYDMLSAAIKQNPSSFSSIATGSGAADLSSTSDVNFTKDTQGYNANATMGQYLILAEKGINTYKPMVVNVIPTFENEKWVLNNVLLKAKGTTPTIDKTVNDLDVEQVGVGDVVKFEINADVIEYPENATAKKFIITDTMSAGLTYMSTTGTFVNQDKTSIDVTPIKVYGITGESKTELTVDIDFAYNTAPSEESQTFKIDFMYDKIKQYESVEIVYYAKINDNALVYDGISTETNNNKVELEYSNDPYNTESSKVVEDKVTVYTYGIKIIKLGQTGNQNINLPGAKFELYRTDEKNGISAETKVNFKGDTTTGYIVDASGVAVLTSNNTGVIKMSGLDTGIYWLQEISAPDGYNVLKDPVKIVIEKVASSNNTVKDYSKNVLNETGDDGYTSGIFILNKKGPTLPETGGIGTVVFTASGLIIMGIVLLIALSNNKKKSKTN